jgi:hypothetical protein
MSEAAPASSRRLNQQFAPPEPAVRPQSRSLSPQRSSASGFARLAEGLRERVSEAASV